MKKLGILVFCILFFSLKHPVLGIPPPNVSFDNKVWFATNSGLYRYDKVQDEWNAFFTSMDIRDIGIDEGVIWIATNSGVYNSDIRFSDWRLYDNKNGLPDNNANCIAFSKDYVWIGTDQGIARFDKLLEEWKIYSEAQGLASQKINDIVTDVDTAWFATANGISRMDINYEKFTTYREPDLPSGNILWSKSLGNYIWFITDKGPVRYNKQLRTWKSYSQADGIVSYQVNNVITAGDNNWLVTTDGVSIYNSESDSWLPGIAYHTMLPSKNINDLALDGDFIWFCTDKGLSRYDKKSGSWRHYKTSDGLLDDKCQSIIISDKVFVITEKGINLFDKNTQDWESYLFSEIKVDKGTTGRKGLRIDNNGIGYDFSKEANVRLSGFSSLEFLNNSRFNEKIENNYNWDSKNDLSLKGNMPRQRSIVGFYNDIREDDKEYGITYRGNEADILQEATAGEFEAVMRNSDLINDTNLLGAGGRLRKSIKGARLNIEPRYGQQRGYFETDFFTYKTGTDIYTLSHTNIIPGTDEVIVKNRKLQAGVDYLIVYPSGWLVFYREEIVEEGEEIEIKYQYESDDTSDDLPHKDRRDENLAVLTTGVDFGTNYYAGLDVLHKDNSDIISINGDGKNISLGPVSMRIRPEFAYSNQTVGEDNFHGTASRGEVLLNVPRTQIKFDYENYARDFWTLDGRETRFGQLNQHLGTYSQVDIANWLPLTILWQRERSNIQEEKGILDQDAMANLVFSKSPYPVLAFTGERNSVKKEQNTETKNSLRGDFQYDIPDYILSYLKFRKGEVKAYYKEAQGQNRIQTGYARIQLSPIERFVLSSSFKLNRIYEKSQLQDEIQKWDLRWDFSTFSGLISNLYLDDLRLVSNNIEDKDRYLVASLNIIPGAWTRKLEIVTLSTRYSLIQQSVPVKSDPEEEKLSDSNSRSFRLQMNLRPHSTMLWTETYERVKSWVEDVTPVKNSQLYRTEAEFKPNSKSRIMLEYLQEHENQDTKLQEKAYSPSIWWENRWSQNWTTRLRSLYQYVNIQESGKIRETGSTITPSISFRYNTKDLPYNGRLYITHALSISVYRGERNERNLSSETYSSSLVFDWKITGNLSFRLRGSLSYEDKHTSGGSDKKGSVYTRVLLRF